jgi:hypothetical protein
MNADAFDDTAAASEAATAAALASLPSADRSRFEELAPYSGAPSQSAADAAWLAHCLARHAQQHPAHAATLQTLLLQHQALRAGLQLQYADLPQAPGWQRAQAAIQALPRRQQAATATVHTASWLGRLSSWLNPSPAWAMALVVLLVPLSFWAGRDTAPGATAPDAIASDATAPYSQVRGTPAAGLFDGPLLRVNFQPQTPEHVIRETLLAQGALLVGPTRLGDWFVKVAPARVPTVRAALAQAAAVATVETVPTLPSELVDPP